MTRVAGVVELEVLPTPVAAARRAAAAIAEAARDAVAQRDACAIALSGGRGARRLLEALADEDVPWDVVGIWQVDERVAPHGHEDRNLTILEASTPEGAYLRPMPVEGDEEALSARAATYASGLPARFDVVHLGLGDDGHTASLVPGDPVLDVHDRDVAVTGSYRGRRRMTLTFPVLDEARTVVWYVTGSAKAGMLRRLLARDVAIPAGRVRAADQLAVVDRAAIAGD